MILFAAFISNGVVYKNTYLNSVLSWLFSTFHNFLPRVCVCWQYAVKIQLVLYYYPITTNYIFLKNLQKVSLST